MFFQISRQGKKEEEDVIYCSIFKAFSVLLSRARVARSDAEDVTSLNFNHWRGALWESFLFSGSRCLLSFFSEHFTLNIISVFYCFFFLLSRRWGERRKPAWSRFFLFSYKSLKALHDMTMMMHSSVVSRWGISFRGFVIKLDANLHPLAKKK